MEIKPIQKVHVGEQVFQQMKRMLILGEWMPGDKLPSENELASLFNVSRITVRQALQKLIALNLIETRLGEGSFVRTLEVEQSLDRLMPTMYLGEKTNIQVFEFRELMDVESVRLATKRRTDEDLERMNDIISHMKKAARDNDSHEFAKLDLEFHFEIGRITGNPLIIKTNAILKDILEVSMDDVIDRMGYKSAIEYHSRILEAIKLQDSELAMKLMREHIEKNIDYFEGRVE
ncbi:MAG: FadR family transcriptional regulator [Clostridium sp.]|nr:FadR family transcriptional regulator [Clostridium sp.]